MLVDVEYVANSFSRDVRTIQLWANDWKAKYNIEVREDRGKYNYVKCAECRIRDLEKENEILEKSGDEKLYAHQLKGQMIKNKEAEIKLKRLEGGLVEKNIALIAWSNQNNTIKSLCISAENEMVIHLGELFTDKTEGIKKIRGTMHTLREDIANIRIEELIQSEESLFEDYDEEETND